jgi:hypothetical protein
VTELMVATREVLLEVQLSAAIAARVLLQSHLEQNMLMSAKRNRAPLKSPGVAGSPPHWVMSTEHPISCLSCCDRVYDGNGKRQWISERNVIGHTHDARASNEQP